MRGLLHHVSSWLQRHCNKLKKGEVFTCFRTSVSTRLQRGFLLISKFSYISKHLYPYLSVLWYNIFITHTSLIRVAQFKLILIHFFFFFWAVNASLTNTDVLICVPPEESDIHSPFSSFLVSTNSWVEKFGFFSCSQASRQLCLCRLVANRKRLVLVYQSSFAEKREPKHLPVVKNQNNDHNGKTLQVIICIFRWKTTNWSRLGWAIQVFLFRWESPDQTLFSVNWE